MSLYRESRRGRTGPVHVGIAAVVTATWLALLPFTGSAQDLEPETSVPDFSGHWSFRWTEIYEDGALLGEGGFGLKVGESCWLGLAGTGTLEPGRYSALEMGLSYGGVRFQRLLARGDRIHTSLALLAGAGSFTVDDTASGIDSSTGITVLEPELSAGVRVLGALRLSLGVSYRWVWGIEGDLGNRSDGDARSGSLMVMVEGW